MFPEGDERQMKKGTMVDLHMHSLLSDGVLLPSELVRRAQDKGLGCVAVTDHADMSNLEQVIGQLVKACSSLAESMDVRVIPGVELTHIPLLVIPDMVRRSREAGARLVLLHGETIVEPVAPGTNRAAIESGVDILAHPGLITPEEVKLAQENSVCLEVSGRKGHSLTNGHVVKLARESGTQLTFGSDTHEPGDIRTFEEAKKICLGAGLSEDEVDRLFENAWKLAEKVG